VRRLLSQVTEGAREFVPRIRIVDAAEKAGAQQQPGLAVDGECHDSDHRGLRRLVTDYPSIDPGDTSWADQDVAVLYLEKKRLLAENRELRLGRADYRSNLWASVFIGFACGLGFIWALGVLLGAGRR
jgi:hypothetical protein